MFTMVTMRTLGFGLAPYNVTVQILALGASRGLRTYRSDARKPSDQPRVVYGPPASANSTNRTFLGSGES